MRDHLIKLILTETQRKREHPKQMPRQRRYLSIVLFHDFVEAWQIRFGRPHISINLLPIQLPVQSITTTRIQAFFIAPIETLLCLRRCLRLALPLPIRRIYVRVISRFKATEIGRVLDVQHLLLLRRQSLEETFGLIENGLPGGLWDAVASDGEEAGGCARGVDLGCYAFPIGETG